MSDTKPPESDRVACAPVVRSEQMSPKLPSKGDVGYGSRAPFGIRMRLALPVVVVVALSAGCSAGSGGSSTGGSGSGTLCSPCTQDFNCIAGGSCVFETAETSQGYCAVP